MTDSKKEQLRNFNPSFDSLIVERLRRIFEAAYEQGIPAIGSGAVFDEIDDKPNDAQYVFEGTVRPATSISKWLSFGHMPVSPAGVPAELSNVSAFKLTVRFNGDELNSVRIEAFLLNPRFIFSETGFRPASIGPNHLYEVVSATSEDDISTVGLLIELSEDANGNTDPTSLHQELLKGLPSSFNKPVAGWPPFVEGNLTGRLDVSVLWQRGDAGFDEDLLGDAQADVSSDIVGGLDRATLGLFSPGSVARFNGLLHESGRFGVDIESQRMRQLNVLLVVGEHKEPIKSATSTEKAQWELLQSALKKFGLNKDFRGLIFSGLRAHWLDDGYLGAEVEVTEALAAVSFHGGNDSPGLNSTKLYAAVDANFTKSDQESYLSVLEDGTNGKEGARLSLELAGTKVRRCALKATFVDLGQAHPLSWLSERTANFSLKTVTIQNGSETQERYAIDVSLDTNSGYVLARIEPGDFGAPSDSKPFTYFATLLTFSPIFQLAKSKISPSQGSDDKRARFVDISTGDSLFALFAATSLDNSWFFKNAIHASELRITGLRVLSQPAGSSGKHDTALLFDVETDFDIANDQLALSSSRALTAKVENTGFAFGASKFRWVQVPDSIFKIDILDSSIWDFGGLGKLLKVRDFNFGLGEYPGIEFKLELGFNIGIIEAGDFKFNLDIFSEEFKLRILPSSIGIEIPGVLKGLGHLSFGDGDSFFDDIAGSLDLTLLSSGLRMRAGARVAKVEAPDGSEKTAFQAGAAVELPTPIPLLNTGLSIRGFDGLFAMHFKRLEYESKHGIPPSLDWLQRAKGEVSGTIGTSAGRELWVPEYDRWSFGLGILLSLQANDQLLNMNTMLMVELPGPRILIFAKVNIFEDPKSSKDKIKDNEQLTGGILGVLEIDFSKKQLILAASIDLAVEDFITIYGSISNQYSFENLAHWHQYIGHHSRHVSADLKLGDIFNAGASGYFMAAGKEITDVPTFGGGQVTLPGFAISLGARAYAKIGSGSLFLRMEMQAFLNVSLSRNIYAAGGLFMSGELYLFIVGIGASAKLEFEYYQNGGEQELKIYGEACGRIKIAFLKLEGCVGLKIGGGVDAYIEIPVLRNKVSLVSGTNVALFGQGAASKIDEAIAVLAVDAEASEMRAPLDTAIAVSMVAAPRLDRNGAGFVKFLKPAAPVTTYKYGGRDGGYELDSVILAKKQSDGSYKDISSDTAPATWWRNTQKPTGRQALPVDLALLTRNPLGAPNALPSDATIDKWVDALLGGICDTTAAQRVVHNFSTFEDGHLVENPFNNTSDLQWPMQGRFDSKTTEAELGTATTGRPVARLSQRYGYPFDYSPGIPQHLGAKVVEYDTNTRTGFAFLKLLSAHRSSELPTKLTLSSAGFVPVGLGNGQSLVAELLVGFEEQAGDWSLDIELIKSDDLSIYPTVAFNPPIAAADELDIEQFHESSENWISHAERFSGLRKLPGYQKQKFRVLSLEIADSDYDEMNPIVGIKINWRSEVEFSPLLIAGIKYLPIEEVRRKKDEEDFNEAVSEEILAFVSPPVDPVLDPNSEYRLALGWKTTGDKIADQAGAETFSFKTTANPPISLEPYLLATYPKNQEQFHPSSHRPGFSISSGDVLRILKKNPEARLKISITEEGNNPVVGTDGNGGDINWHEGVLYDPAEMLDIAADLPGLERSNFNAIPSRLMWAIKKAIEEGKLHCIDGDLEFDKGQWFGIRADLDPLRWYRVSVTIAESSGIDWPYVPENEQPVPKLPFLEWKFRTGVHGSLNEHADEFARTVFRNRRLGISDLPEAEFPSESLKREMKEASTIVEVDTEFLDIGSAKYTTDEIRLVPDQAIEDLLARFLDERPTLNAEADITLIRAEDEAATVQAVLLRSRDPMIRTAPTVKVSSISTDLGTTNLLVPGETYTRYFDPASPDFDEVYVSSSGTSAIAFVSAGAVAKGSGLELKLVERTPKFIKHDEGSAVVLKIPREKMVRMNGSLS